MKITIKEVARLAGVSVTTVSQILNQKGGRFSESTKERVLKVIEEQQYSPNYFASNIIAKKTKTIGVIVPDFAEQFASAIVRQIRDQLEKKGYYLIICESSHDFLKEQELLSQLARIAVEGIFLFTPNDYSGKKIIEHGRFQEIPVVFADRGLNKGFYGTVKLDEYSGVYRAIEWLVAEGHQKIGLIMDNAEHYHLAERFEAYQQALSDHELLIEEKYIKYMPLTITGGYQGATDLLKETEVSAIFCCDDMLAIGCYQAVYVSEKKMNQDITIIGFDGGEVTQIVRPQIESVRQPYQERGKAYAEKIQMAIDQPERRMDDRLFHVIFDPGLSD